MSYIYRCRGAVIIKKIAKKAAGLICVGGTILIVLVSQPVFAAKTSVDRQHKQAMTFARVGQHDRALRLLQSLTEKYPGRYAIHRDYILVASWKGDCDRVLAGYDTLQKKYRHYSRVVIPAARCLREQNRVREAIKILDMALARSKHNLELKKELVAARQELAGQKITTEYELGTNNSDGGNREWRGQAMVWGEVGDHLHGRARFTLVHATDPQFATGDLNRVGVGLEYSKDALSLDGEVSSDIIRGGETGLSATAHYALNDRWKLTVAHHTFSEDVPLRAKALYISSSQSHLGARFHTPDYVWEWLTAMDSMDFSDGNRRREWLSELGYGLDLKPEREKRIMFEVSQASNTLGGTVYYNPLSAQTLIGGYKLTRVHKSEYKRKTDETYVWLGNYQQQNVGSNLIYGARYQQNYELNDESALMWRIGAASKVYDGARESEVEAGLRYTKVLQ